MLESEPFPSYSASMKERRMEGLLQEALRDGTVRCNTCCRRCVIPEGKTGWCRTRRVENGRLVVLTYGLISSLAANPIEKKPFYHFHPGTSCLTAGGWGCNFACPWCQNWEISKHVPGDRRSMSAAAFVEATVAQGCQGTSISFNEPTLSLEWSLEVFRAARARRPPLYNTFVSNGYMTPEALRLLAEAGLDAINVDIKGDAEACRKYCQIDVGHVWEACGLSLELGLHLEIITLVIPGVNDEEAQLRGIAERMVRELGTSVPWHVNAYYPCYRFRAPPTPMGTLERAQEIGREAGLEYVYLGNVIGPGGNTNCPSCGSLLVERGGLSLLSCRVTADGKCPDCGRAIAGVGWGAAGA